MRIQNITCRMRINTEYHRGRLRIRNITFTEYHMLFHILNKHSRGEFGRTVDSWAAMNSDELSSPPVSSRPGTLLLAHWTSIGLAFLIKTNFLVNMASDFNLQLRTTSTFNFNLQLFQPQLSTSTTSTFNFKLKYGFKMYLWNSMVNVNLGSIQRIELWSWSSNRKP